MEEGQRGPQAVNIVK
ncbi:hypothetical protein NG885_19970 [Enterococcus faecium]|nr:hypothetical protein [Enterococcus faecium]